MRTLDRYIFREVAVTCIAVTLVLLVILLSNQLARVLFLKREFREALQVLERVAAVDPEDIQMHYTMMLCYRALGDKEGAAREEQLFRRFKADEASQAITARRRTLSPEDNNERQAIHEHESVRLERGVR